MIIGLTGGIASGKSTVSNMLKSEGLPIIDADIIAREAVEPGKPAHEKITDHFGQGILNEDSTLNREQLGSIIFNNPEERDILNGIVHPEVRGEMKRQAEDYAGRGHNLIVMDIPLLVESNLFHLVDKVVLVYSPASVQLERLMERNGYSEEEALSRINSQISIEEKRDKADFIIDNSGSLHETEVQVKELIKILKEE